MAKSFTTTFKLLHWTAWSWKLLCFVFIIYHVQSLPMTLPQKNKRQITNTEGEYGLFIEGDIRELPGARRKRMVPQDSMEETVEGSSEHDYESQIANNAQQGAVNLWPNGRVPFKYDSGLGSDLKLVFSRAMNWWMQVSCVKFEPAKLNDTAYLNLTDKKKCSSFVGRIGIMQEVSIGNKGCRSEGNAAHELGHALGLWHEHTRPDRDAYIRVNWDNIEPGTKHNFNISKHEGIPDVGYDFYSIMHYNQHAFSTDKRGSKPTIDIVYNVPQCFDLRMVGQRNMLSLKDKLRMSKLYNCTANIRVHESTKDGCPLIPTTPPPTSTPAPPKKCKKVIRTGEQLAIDFENDSRYRVGCSSTCHKYECDNEFLKQFQGGCGQEKFTIIKVLNGKNKNLKSGNPVALQSQHRAGQFMDCSRGSCSLSFCPTFEDDSSKPITQQVCIHHRLRMYAANKANNRLINRGDTVYFKHLDEDKFLNCHGRRCRLITEGTCESGTASGSSGSAVCERQYFKIDKVEPHCLNIR